MVSAPGKETRDLARLAVRLGRWVHALIAAALAGCGWQLSVHYPDLIKDAPTTFSTVSGLLTLFGVTFAIIEVMRIEGATRVRTH